ncbi:MAG: VWA domain-containing protein [Planctomycetota bacterium]|nr:VWA domain-containing protein [Planctomycetota bacterium]RLS81543.1 MAG: VWA domain-containing protein [Planctomycetota bacterium]
MARHITADGEPEGPDDGAMETAAILSRDLPALAASLVLHVVLLLVLALAGVATPPPTRPSVTVIETPLERDDEIDLAPQEMIVSDMPEETGAAGEDQSADVAQSLAPVLDTVSMTPVEAIPELVGDIQVDPLDALPTATEIDQAIVVRGAVGATTSGAAGAVDRLTAEIDASLQQRPTVVVWVFDQSVSLSAQRKEIASRLERVFQELGADRSQRHRPDLQNLVVAFGKNVSLVTKKPTDDVAEVIRAIDSVPVDDSGVEMTFAAIRAAADSARIYRTSAPKKNVMIVAFTDEVGNDQQLADQTAQHCRKLGIPVYVVGVPAPFGMREVRMKYVEFDPKFDAGEDEQWAVIEQGPETLFPEVVRVRSGAREDEAIDSGFGPFSLSKLCAETGGIYFRVHPNSGERGRVTNQMVAPMAAQIRYFFDPDVMQTYQPDYVSAAKLQQDIAANEAKRALVEAARSTEIQPMESPVMTFPRRDEPSLAGLLSEAQKAAAKAQPRIDAIHATLTAGAAGREAIKERRWQAGYDLALGRVLAAKVRTDAYNQMLAQAKLGMKFQDEKSDTWQLEPSDEVTVGSQTEKLAKQASELLERVVHDHAGTPWAQLAATELRTPLGYRWTERFTGVNTPQMADAGNNNNVPAPPTDDQKRKLGPPKPKRNLKNL